MKPLLKNQHFVVYIVGGELEIAIDITHEPWQTIARQIIEKTRELMEDEEYEIEGLEALIEFLKDNKGHTQ